jgi:hypothetical protein
VDGDDDAAVEIRHEVRRGIGRTFPRQGLAVAGISFNVELPLERKSSTIMYEPPSVKLNFYRWKFLYHKALYSRSRTRVHI